MRKFAFLLLTTGLLSMLVGCSETPKDPGDADQAPRALSIERLRMPPPDAFGVEKIEIKSVVRAHQAPALFEREGLLSSAYYKYWRPDGSAYKVRLNIYESVPDLQRGWDKRFPADTLAGTTPLGAGLPGFVQREKIAATRIDTVLIEITTSKGADRLAAFTEFYADYVRTVWQPG